MQIPMCVGTFVRMCIWRLEVNIVSLLCSPVYFTETESLVEPGTHNSGSLISQLALWLLCFNFPVLDYR